MDISQKSDVLQAAVAAEAIVIVEYGIAVAIWIADSFYVISDVDCKSLGARHGGQVEIAE